MDTYQVTVSGQCLAGFEPDSVRQSLAVLANLPESMAARLLAGRPVVVKSSVDQATAERYTARLRAIGVDASAISDASLKLDFELAGRLSASEGSRKPYAAPSREPALTSHSQAEFDATTRAGLDLMYRAAIGPRNTSYYLERFSRMDARGGSDVLWNWSAFFFTGTWALYRKLYGAFFALWGWALFCGLLEKAGADLWAAILGIASMLVSGSYANAIYRHKVQRMIVESVGTSQNRRDAPDALRDLEKKGGVHRWVFWASAIFICVGIIAAISIPVLRSGVQQSTKLANEKIDPRDVVVDTPMPQAGLISNGTGSERRQPMQTANLIGSWRCVTISSENVEFWTYMGNGKLWYYGDRSINNSAIVGANVPTHWSLENNVLVWQFADKGPDWVAENVIQEFGRDRLKYRNSAGNDVACTRLVF